MKKTTRKITMKNSAKKIISVAKKLSRQHKYCIAAISILVAILVVTAFIYPGFLKSKAQGFSFLQTNWSTGNYQSIDGLDNSGGQLTLAKTGIGFSGDKIMVGGASSEKSSENFPVTISASNSSTLVFWDSSFDNTPGSVYAQKINGDGSLGSGSGHWDTDRTLISGTTPTEPNTGNMNYYLQPKVAKTSDGAFMVVWKKSNMIGGDIMVQKILEDGTHGAALGGGSLWADDGISLNSGGASGGSSSQRIVTGSNGTSIIFWISGNSIVAQRVNADGTLGGDNWTIDPLKEGEIIESSAVIYNNQAYDVVAVSDGVIVYWIDSTGGGPSYTLNAQKVLWDGTLGNNIIPAQSWPADGLMVANNAITGGSDRAINYNGHVQAQVFGNQIVIVFNCWDNSISNSSVCVQKIISDGTTVGGAGDPIIANGYGYTNFVNSVKSGSDGVIVEWADLGDNNRYFQKINLNGDPLWGSNGISESQNPEVNNIVSDGADGVIIAGNYQGSIKVEKLDGTTGASVWSRVFNSTNNPFQRFSMVSHGIDDTTLVWDEQVQQTPSSRFNIFAQRIGVNNGDYLPSGSLVSNVINGGGQLNWNSLEWAADIQGASSITFETRTASEFPSNIASSGTAHADSELAVYGYPASGAIDADPMTGWAQNFNDPSAVLPQRWWLEFPSAVDIRKIVIKSLDSPGGSVYPITYDIQTSSDGINWDVPIATEANDPNGIIDNINIVLPSTINTKYISINVKSANPIDVGGGPIQLAGFSKFEVYSSNAGWSCDWDACPTTTLTNSSGASGSIDLSSLPSGQYFQYKVTMTRGSAPTLTGLTISGSPVPTGPPPAIPTYAPEEKNETTPETPAGEGAEGVANPISQPTVCSNTLEQVQTSPIPPFNETWGVGYRGGGRVNWALDHRAGIYQLYLDYLGRAPCASEVNSWLQASDDINLIRYDILISEEYLSKHQGL